MNASAVPSSTDTSYCESAEILGERGRGDEKAEKQQIVEVEHPPDERKGEDLAVDREDVRVLAEERHCGCAVGILPFEAPYAALEGLRVIDLSRVLAGPFCAMLLGDMGADVIKIEEPNEGDDARMWGPFVGSWSAYFLGVNRNKRSVALDLKIGRRPGRAPRAAASSADVFIENIKPGSLDKLGFGVDAVRDA